MPSKLEYKKQIEDEVMHEMETWTQSKKLIAYLYLHSLGVNLANLGVSIDKALAKEMANHNEP